MPGYTRPNQRWVLWHPRFFFSYASIDGDEHLDKFFGQINSRVQRLVGTRESGFRDVQRIESGDQWDEKLIDDLATSPAMVCMFSPAYFKSPVCAQELQLFLERRAEYKRKKGKLPASIIPVLWQPTSIPLALPELNEERPRSLDHRQDGVWRLGDLELTAELNGIAHTVAQRVKDAHRTPLFPLSYRPVLGGVESAFEPSPPLPPKEFDLPNAIEGPRCVTLVHASMPPWGEWPFDLPDKPLLHIAASVVKSRDLCAHGLTFDPVEGGLVERLQLARSRNNHLLILVDGASLSEQQIQRRMLEYDKYLYDLQLHDSCGTLIGWRVDTVPSNWKSLVDSAFPNLSSRQTPTFHAAPAGPEEFARRVRGTFDTLRNLMIKNAQSVTPISAPTQYSSVPYSSGPVDRRVA